MFIFLYSLNLILLYKKREENKNHMLLKMLMIIINFSWKLVAFTFIYSIIRTEAIIILNFKKCKYFTLRLLFLLFFCHFIVINEEFFSHSLLNFSILKLLVWIKWKKTICFYFFIYYLLLQYICFKLNVYLQFQFFFNQV